MDESDLIIGIDLGTTHSLVSVVDSGFPIILADAAGERILASVVHRDSQEDLVVGSVARRAGVLAPERTVRSVKRLMGRNHSDLTAEELSGEAYNIIRGEGGEILIDLGGAEPMSPEQISARILAELKQTAERALETSISRAVITVPAYFNHAQRESTKRAGELAGLKVERILSEPTAAALAYGFEETSADQTIAVYDWGGGTFDLSILAIKDGVFEVVATNGDTNLGGDDLDEAISRWIVTESGLSGQISSELDYRISELARSAKEALSNAEETTVALPFLPDGRSVELVLSRSKFEEIARPLIEKTLTIGERALFEAGQKGIDTIDHLILVGGSTRIPLVRERAGELFGLQPDTSQHPDEAIALGAGIQAGILCGRVKNVVLIDIIPLSLGIETFGGLMNVIIPRNMTIPAKAGE
ncbi:MAG: Hsp70 family protein, partial [Verrucomicrobiota bacterium]